MNLNFLKSAFDRIGSQSKQLEQIAAASETTAAAVTAGGVLYTKVDEMVVLLRQIAENGMASSKEALKDAKVLGLVGKAMEPLGKGFQLLVAALNELPNADEATRKMDALVGGLVKLGDVGKSILQFAGYMALAAPLLLLAAIASPLALISLFFITKGLELVNNKVDKESLEKMAMLGDVGKSILLLGGSLALFGLIGPLAITGALFAGISLLLIGGTFALLNKIGLDGEEMQKKGEALTKIGISLLALGGTLALIGALSGLVLKGALVAGLSVLMIGGTFALLNKMNLDNEELVAKGEALTKIGIGLLALGGTLALIGALSGLVLKGALVAGLSVLMIGGTFALLNKIGLDGEEMQKKGEALTKIGISLLVLGGSLALIGALGGLVLKGALVAGLAVLMIGGTFALLNKMNLDNEELEAKGKALTKIGISLLAFGAPLALLGVLSGLVLKGALVAGLAVLMIGGTFALLNKIGLDGEEMQKKGEALTKIGISLLVLGGSLALFGLIGPLAIKGALFAGISLLIIGGTFALLNKMNLDDKELEAKGKALTKIGIGLLALGGSLALIGLFGGLVLKGALVASIAVLAIGGVFWVLDKMKVIDKMEDGAKGLAMTALSILALGISLALFDLVAPEPKKILQIGAVIAGTAVAFGIIGIFGDTILKGAKAMGFVALSILALGLSLYFFDMLVPGDILSWDTLKAFVVVGALGAGFYLAGKGASTIAKGALAMLIAGVALIVIGLGVKVLDSALPKENTWERIGQMGAVIGGLGVAMALAGASGGLIALGALQMIVAGISLIVIAGGVAALDAALPKKDTWERIGQMGALIGGLGVAMALAGASGGLIALGALQMIVAGISLIVIAGGVAALDAALPKKDTWERIGQMGAVIGGLAVAMAAAGVASPFILLGSAAMLVAGVAVMVIAGGVAILSALPAKKLFSKGGLFGDSGQTGFFGGVKSNFEVMMDAIADGVAVNPITAAGMLLGSAAFITAGVALLSIGKGIAEFQKVAEKADLKNLNTNVNLIVSSLAETFGTIGTLYPGGAAGLFSGGSVVAQGIDATMGMGRALTGIARGMQAMANLQFPTKFDKEGNPIEFESMDSDAPARVATNAAMITGVLATVFGKIGERFPGGKASLFSSIFGSGKQSAVADGISSVMGMGDALTGIALGVQAMADLKFPTAYDKNGKPIAFESVNISDKIKQVASNVNLILLGEDGVSGLVGTFTNVGKANGPDKGLFTSTDYEKGVEMIQNVGTPLLNLAEGVQMMANLRFPTKYDKDGKAIAFTDAKGIPAKLKQVENNVKMILLGKDGKSGLVGIFKSLGAEDDSGWFSSSTIERGAEIAKMISEPIKNIADAASKLMEGNWDATDAANKIKILIGALTSGNDTDPKLLDTKRWLWIRSGEAYEKMGQSIPSIINALNTVKPEGATAFRNAFWGVVDAKDPAAGYAAQGYAWTRIGDAMPKIGDGMEVTAGAINSMDLKKLTEARTMFEALATLTHGGDANNILSKMGDSLETALQNLAEMLNNFKDTVEEGNVGQQGALGAVSSAVSSLKQIVAPAATRRTTAQTTAAPQNNIDMSGVVRAIEDLENVLVQQGVRVRTI